LSVALVVDKVTTEAALRQLEPEWLALEDASGCALPFRTATWTQAWWTHLRRHSPALRDVLSVRTVRTRQGELLGVAPFMLTERPGVGFVRARCLNFIGADRNVTELRGPLFKPEAADECILAIRDHLMLYRHEWDWMVWSGLAKEGRATAELGADSVTFTRDVPYYTVALGTDWASFKSSRSRNIKESLRKCYNSLKRDGLTPTLDVAATREETATALSDFFRLHSARADRTDAPRHPNTFETDRLRAFLVDVTGRLADRKIARVFRLRVNDRVVAARVGFIQNKTLYLYYSGYEPDMGKYSIATTMVAEMMQYAYTQGVDTLNLSTGTDVSKMRWSPDEWVVREGVATSPRPLARLAHGAFRMVDNALAQIKKKQAARAAERTPPREDGSP